MKAQQQTRKEANGNCLQACIASLLEVKIEKVPDFVLTPDDGDAAFPAWWKSLQGWLGEMGLWFLEVQLPPGQPWMPIPMASLCILFGETTTGVKHAIVGRCEGADFFPLFNPWPEAEFAGGVAAVGFILARDPAMPVKFGMALDRIEKLSKPCAAPKLHLDNISAICEQTLHRESDNFIMEA